MPNGPITYRTPFTNPADQAYYRLYLKVMEEGTEKLDRTGVGTISCFGESYRLPVSFESFPILTTKKINWRSLVAELVWYVSGEPHIRNLQKYTKIWDDWANVNGQLETAYGRYWRAYPLGSLSSLNQTVERDGKKLEQCTNAEVFSSHPKYFRAHRFENLESERLQHYQPSFDQLAAVVDELKKNPNSRRLHVTAWYPPNAFVSVLPPCHHSWTLNVNNGKLNLHLQQRSGDLGLGIPWNLSCYSLILLLLCRETGLEPGEFWHTITDLHIYKNHIEPLGRWFESAQDYPAPKLDISELGQNLINLTEENIDQIKLVGYQHGPFVKLPVAV